MENGNAILQSVIWVVRLDWAENLSLSSKQNTYSKSICPNYVDVLFHQYLFVETL